jgi:methyl-accepting chemotaxis protein
MFSFFRTRLKNKIALLPVSAVLLMSTFTLFYFPANKRSELMKVLSEQVTATADLLAFGLGVALDSDRFDAISEGFNVAKGVGAVAYILIYDNNNKFLSAFNPDSIPVSETHEKFDVKPQKKDKYIEKATPIKFGKQSYGTVVVGVSRKTIDSSVSATFYIMLGIGVLLSVISIIVALIVSTRIVKPLNDVQQAMEALGKRNLKQKCKVDSVDETAIMAGAVNTAIESLRQSLSVTSNGAERISAAISTLSSVANTMTDNSAVMADKSKSVSVTINDAISRLENIKSSSNDVTLSIQTVAASIEEMNSSLNEVAKNCNNEFRIAESASVKVNETLGVMQALGAAAKEISTINDFINTIAQQTKLLSLNATIEAANAGVYGKGFAVVAQEVKLLAQKIDNATNQIARQIEGIQTKADNAVVAMSDVTSVVDEIKNISHSIAAAVEQQSVTVSGIAQIGSKTSSSAETITRDVSRWAEEMSNISSSFTTVENAASTTAGGAEEIDNSVKELKKLSVELTATVEQFVL